MKTTLAEYYQSSQKIMVAHPIKNKPSSFSHLLGFNSTDFQSVHPDCNHFKNRFLTPSTEMSKSDLKFAGLSVGLVIAFSRLWVRHLLVPLNTV